MQPNFRIDARLPFVVCVLLLLVSNPCAAAGQWVRSVQLQSPHPADGANFGAAVAMSGTTLVVGQPAANVNGTLGAGNVYIYELVNDHWQLTDELQTHQYNFVSDHGHFGAAVAISGDDLTVGLPDADCCVPNIPGIGFQVFYHRDFVTRIWGELGGVSGSVAGSHFGASVAIDGPFAAGGAPASAILTGSVRTWKRNASGGWSTTGFVSEPVDGYGSSVAIAQSGGAGGGPTLIVGAPQFVENSQTGVGAAYVYYYSNSSWQFFQALTASIPGQGYHFGTAIATDGAHVFVGVPGRDSPTGTEGLGSVDVFAINSAGNYSFEQAIYTTQQSAVARVGASVACSLTGAPRLYIGAPLGNGGATDAGSTFVFEPNGNPPWSQADRLTLGADAQSGDQLGGSVAISGGFAAAGAIYHDVPGMTNAGIVQIFVPDSIFANGFQ
jgi:FG-GAP repeat